MVDADKYKAVLDFAFPQNRKELNAAASQEDGKFNLACEYHAAKIVIKKLLQSTIHSASERAILMDQVKALESHIKFTGDNINALNSNDIPTKPLGMSDRSLTKIFGTMALIIMKCTEPHLAHNIVNNYQRMVEDKYVDYGIEIPFHWEVTASHILDAIELCSTDGINEKFPPSDILRTYIYVFMRMIVEQSSNKLHYGNNMNFKALSEVIKEKIEFFTLARKFQPVDNLSRLDKTLASIHKQLGD